MLTLTLTFLDLRSRANTCDLRYIEAEAIDVPHRPVAGCGRVSRRITGQAHCAASDPEAVGRRRGVKSPHHDYSISAKDW